MSVLICGVGLFCISFLIHLIIWRIKIPKRQSLGIFIIFFTVLLVFLMVVPFVPAEFPYLAKFGIEYFYIILFQTSLTFSYILSYPGIEAESPSSLMVLALAKMKSVGLSRKDFDQIVTDELFVGNRIDHLFQGRYVCCEQEKYKITSEGVTFLRLFLLPHRVMGRDKIGG